MRLTTCFLIMIATSQAIGSFEGPQLNTKRTTISVLKQTTLDPPPPTSLTPLTPLTIPNLTTLSGGATAKKKGGFCPYHFVLGLKIPFFFALWYALNIYYNIMNKQVLNKLPLPITIGSVQLLIGAFYVQVMWAANFRARPESSFFSNPAVKSVGLMHSLGQLASMVSLNAGSVAFTHIVKAMEPFFSAGISALVFKKLMNPIVYATLIPVVAGVGIACWADVSFTWIGFLSAMFSNLCFPSRAVFSKIVMNRGGISAANLYGLVTREAFKFAIPFIFFEMFTTSER